VTREDANRRVTQLQLCRSRPVAAQGGSGGRGASVERKRTERLPQQATPMHVAAPQTKAVTCAVPFQFAGRPAVQLRAASGGCFSLNCRKRGAKAEKRSAVSRIVQGPQNLLRLGRRLALGLG
jgi:hypothetical protein